MSEEERSRSALNSLISNFVESCGQNSNPPTDDYANYTREWINEIRKRPNPELHICKAISRLEDIIDSNQSYAQKCEEAIEYMIYSSKSRAEISSKRNELKTYEKKITDSETALQTIGPCPIKNCSRHHAIPESPETENKSQYKNSTLSPIPKVSSPTDFKLISPKKAAKTQTNKPISPIETSNKFSQLMEIDESVEAPKIHVPAIKLKIVTDYNLTLQEINRNFPKTLNKLDRGYIRITPDSLEERENIIEYLDKNKKEYVLSEAPENRPLKAVIKGLPKDHNKELISRELEENNFKVLRISQFRNFRQKTMHPVFLVEIAKSPISNNIFKVNRLNLFTVEIQMYRKKQKATMCYNCSDFFHSARNCRCNSRCIKCNGPHETRSCSIKTKIHNPTCINCNEKGHIASWRGCPKIPIINTNKIPTYAQKLRTNLPNPDRNSKNPELKQTPALQAQTEDLADIERHFNALKIISDTLKKFPNIIEISEKLLLAKNDLEKINLLLQLIKNSP
ncbi:hypothetical protein AVEN_272451-1 [Araneus ventricosus]|uniref:CCHC-type domain-containing protein n=1 Tax=Araneus ventricosus TaxID=182803 RepID=A0A4Y2V221_ARAVE|nr:hypothetical protein AVEN_272451-1 [Araneus ventricosus]